MEVPHRKQAELMGTSYTWVHNRAMELHSRPIGHPTKFNPEEELHLKDLLLSCSRIGVPLSIKLFYSVVDSKQNQEVCCIQKN